MSRAPDLRLIVITDFGLTHDPLNVVRRALAAGAPAVQLRHKTATPARLLELAREIRDLTRAAGALLFVNDRLDVALAAGADGVHLGPEDLPVAAARAVAPDGFLIGYSTDRPDRAARAVRDGADYIGCGAVFGTTSKQVDGERIGPAGLERVVRAVDRPVVGIGGIDTDNVRQVAATGAAGAAVIGAVMAAPDPAAAVRSLLRPFER